MTISIQKIEYHDLEHGGYQANIVEATILENGETKKLTFYRQGSKHGVELYSGENYIAGSNKHSHSRNFVSEKRVPAKYKTIINKLKQLHDERYG